MLGRGVPWSGCARGWRVSGAQLYSVRGARLVAAGRAVLAAFLLVSVTLGALEEGDHGALVRLLLGLYLVYGLALLLTLRSRMASHWLTVAPYAPACVDLAVFTALLYLTKGADSPFFSPLLFLVLSATVQWGSRGALAMGAAAVAAFIPAALGALGDGDRAALTTVVRLGTVTVVIGLLTAFARHQERVVEELARLSDPMNDAAHDADPPVREGLAHALNVFRARRGVFLWAEDDEPYVRAVQTDGDDFTERWAPPTEDEWLVHPELAASVFLYDRNTGRTVSRLAASRGSAPRRCRPRSPARRRSTTPW